MKLRIESINKIFDAVTFKNILHFSLSLEIHSVKFMFGINLQIVLALTIRKEGRE